LLKSLLQKGSMNPIGTLCEAIETPLLRKPRVVYKKGEALELFQSPCQTVNTFVEERCQAPSLRACASVEARSITSPEKVQQQAGRPWELVSLSLGILPNKEAIAAFIGKRGALVKALRLEMRNRFRDNLDKKARHKFDFWLDVQTQAVPAPVLERGDVKVTARARLPQGDLQQVLHALKEYAAPAIQVAKQRAERPTPQPKKRIRLNTCAHLNMFDAFSWHEHDHRALQFSRKHQAKSRRLRRSSSIGRCRSAGSSHSLYKKLRYISKLRTSRTPAQNGAASRRSLKQQEHRDLMAVKARLAKREMSHIKCCRAVDW